MALPELPENACPLLQHSPGVRDRFNQLAAQLNSIELDDPGFFARRDLQELTREAVALDLLLRRPRYQVGFLGLYQVGKSRTLNRVLRADSASRPAFEGQTGSACTATVTRVHSAGSAQHALTLHYLSRSDYERRRDLVVERLAERCPLNPGDDAVLLGQIPALLDQARQSRDLFLERNLEYLQRLLLACRRHGREVLRAGDALEIAQSPYDRRWQYINHTGSAGDDPTAPLLRDVSIDYVTDIVPRQVELIDMPGLGTGWVLDTLLTEQLLQEVNGALLFYEVSNNLDSEVLGEVLVRLRRAFPDGLRGRVWIVFTKCDVLTPFHFAEDDRNILAGIAAFLRSRELTPEQIVFVCNQWDGESSDYIAGEIRRRTQTDDLATRFAQFPELVQAFLALRDNGGIDRLRQLITRDLHAAVEAETRREVERRLHTLEDQLRTACQLREEEIRFDPQRHGQLLQVLRTLRQVLGHVDRRGQLLEPGEQLRDYFTESALLARETLIGVFDTLYPQGNWLLGETLDRVCRLFPGHARLLEERLTALLASDMVPAVFRRVGDEFARAPDVAIVACPRGLRTNWDELANADRRDRAWRSAQTFPTFLDAEGALFGPSAAPAQATLNGLSYRELMLDKIRTVTHQCAHALRVRVRHHLQQLEQAYREALETQDHLAREAR
ncbi:MAG: hypothetical protein U0840_12740 [Gemmataceae bacterium]